jgi:hypothetical protein
MDRKISCLFLFFVLSFNLFSVDIPQSILYTQIYDFVDELANDNIIEIQSTIKPYSREYITQKLLEAKQKENLLSNRQRKDLDFYLNDYALEQNKLPTTAGTIFKNENSNFAFIQPAFNYIDTLFKCRVLPALGADVYVNAHGAVADRWVGADMQSSIGKNLSIYAGLRDFAHRGEALSEPTYLNNLQGNVYKSSAGGDTDNSEMRGGIKYSWNWGSIGLVKDYIEWGDNYHGSNIISGRTPSFPMITFHIKPAKWVELNYIHGWLVSDVIDSTRYYVDNTGQKDYRYTNKYIAANMLTITPVKKLNISIGNSIVYAESNIQPAYLIPFMFYKSIDHTLTNDPASNQNSIENQNSQIFFDCSSRNINHLHLYYSVYIDELMFGRFNPSNPASNPISNKIGFKLTDFPIKDLSFITEYTHTTAISYKESIPAITFSSSDYNLGSYLGDNAQEIYLALDYKPIRGIDFTLSYMDAEHGNEYQYDRHNITQILSQGFMKDIVWSNQTLSFKTLYEIFNNTYASVNFQYSNIQGYNLKSTPIVGEDPPYTAQGYLDLYTPKFLQGKNLTLIMSLSFGF